MRKVYYLSSCATCKRILSVLPLDDFEKQDIKTDPITREQLDAMKALSGSYESLFSRLAMKYRTMGLNTMELTEDDYRKYILEEYTFLKRPVFIVGNELFAGSSKKNIRALEEKLILPD